LTIQEEKPKVATANPFFQSAIRGEVNLWIKAAGGVSATNRNLQGGGQRDGCIFGQDD